MTGQLQVTQITIAPPRPADPPRLLCYASIVFCHCFEVAGIRLVRHNPSGKAQIHFAPMLQIDSTGTVRRREQARPTNQVTRSMIEWVVLRAYRDWLDTNAARGRHDEASAKELAP